MVGELTVAYETLALGSAPGVRIVTYLADSGTPSADALALLRSWIAPTGPSLEAENSSPLSPPTSSGLCRGSCIPWRDRASFQACAQVTAPAGATCVRRGGG